ncbi:S24 family peptidase [Porphyromonadaceae bacterium W3.11]|nr:S24 family peptidase [Porphyromonadaceae bacterium W3.11]
MGVNDRRLEQLYKLIKHFSNGTKTDFAEKLGMSPQALNNWFNRGTFDIELLYERFSELSPEWLITGKGDMFRESNSVNGTYLENKEDYEVAKGLGMSLIPEYTDTFRGGEVGNMISTDTIKAYWALPNTKADMIIEVEGDSMSSSYPAGSKVAIRKIQFDRQYPTVNIPFGEVFAIVIDNDDDNYLTFIKRLRRHPDKSLQNKFWIAQSDNAAYDDFEIEISKVRHLFIAVASIKLTGY